MSGHSSLRSLRLRSPIDGNIKRNFISQLTALKGTVNCTNTNTFCTESHHKRFVEDYEQIYLKVHVYQVPEFGRDIKTDQVVWEDRTVVQHEHDSMNSKNESKQVNSCHRIIFSGTQTIKSWSRENSSRRSKNHGIDNHSKHIRKNRSRWNSKIRSPFDGNIPRNFISHLTALKATVNSTNTNSFSTESDTHKKRSDEDYEQIYLKVHVHQVPVFGRDIKTDQVVWEDRTVVQH